MNPHHLAIFPVLGLLCISLTRAETPGKNLLADKTLPDWEFITAVPTALDGMCTLGADGVLAISGKPLGYLATKESHENYQLHFEWRWPANAEKASNGGVLLHINSGPVAGTPWPVCLQVQLKLDHAGDLLPMATARFAEKLSSAPDAKPPQLERSGVASEKPKGEWNTGVILCHGNVVEVRLNGVLQNRVSQCEPATGKIGFQLEGFPFELRKVRIQVDGVISK